MSIWTRITDAIAALLARGEALSAFFDRRRAAPERSVAFTIAVIALGAKMAKADGRVRPSEVTAFRQVFQIAASDEDDAARVFNLARQDIAGFDVYAKRIRRMFADRPQVLEDILEGLFHIAMADGTYHEGEEEFLRRVGEIFGIGDRAFACIEARHVGGTHDPWLVLGVTRDMPLAEIRARWRDLVRTNHPDRMIARGLPQETVTLANARMSAINEAWKEISTRSEGGTPVGDAAP